MTNNQPPTPDEITRAVKRLKALVARSRVAWLRPEIDASDRAIWLRVYLMVQVQELCDWHQPARQDFETLSGSYFFQAELLNDTRIPDGWFIDKIEMIIQALGAGLLKEPERFTLDKAAQADPEDDKT